MYQVTEKDLVGDLIGFPVEVVQKMIERQVEQGNEADVTVFQDNVWASDVNGGFFWADTDECSGFWYNIIKEKDFDLFFQKYPKQKQEYHRPEFALQQFIGYVSGRRGEGVIHLVESIGLSKREWEEIKDDCIFNNGDLREELEEYFKGK